MYRLRPCLTALRVLAISANPNRYLLVERHIDEYLRTHHSLAHALEALRLDDGTTVDLDHEDAEAVLLIGSTGLQSVVRRSE